MLCISGLAFVVLPVGAASPRHWINPVDGMIFVQIPAGSCQMSVPSESDGQSGTLKSIEFRQFWMGATEVTVGQFRKFARATGHVTKAEKDGNRWTWRNPGFRQTAKHPVVYIHYEDARSYARWAGVDLPTQAEWLYAFKAGSTNRYYWGEDLDDRFAWYRANTRGTGTRPVAGKLPNAWGLYDMVGNAWEYCSVEDDLWRICGSSWSRCNSYLTRQGSWAIDMVAQGVEMRLHRAEKNPQYPPYPWDDDRGFRCVRREK